MDLSTNNFWQLTPYCFCDGRDWLTIDDVITTVIPLEGENEEERAVYVAGLSRDDTALLAAFLTALALFLFLLFLLLCCLFPWGLCCRGKDGGCGWCCGGKGKKSKDAYMTSSENSSSGSVNMTALDMKIPRPWTDYHDGYSDSEFEKSGKLYAETNVDNTDHKGFTNNGYQKGSSAFFQDGGWFSASDLDSVYGSVTGRGSGRGRDRRSSVDDLGSTGETMVTRNQIRSSQKYSRSVDDVDGLMAYPPSQNYGNETATTHSQLVASSSAHTGSSRTMNNNNNGGNGGDVTSFTRFHSDGASVGVGGECASIIEELKLTRTKTLQLPEMQAAQLSQQQQTQRIGDFPSMTSPLPYKEAANQIVPSAYADSGNATMSRVTSSMTSQDRPADNDVISEYRAYKRVMKETTTTTTTTE